MLFKFCATHVRNSKAWANIYPYPELIGLSNWSGFDEIFDIEHVEWTLSDVIYSSPMHTQRPLCVYPVCPVLLFGKEVSSTQSILGWRSCLVAGVSCLWYYFCWYLFINQVSLCVIKQIFCYLYFIRGYVRCYRYSFVSMIWTTTVN